MKIQVTGNTYPHIFVAYLLDKLMHLDTVSQGNEEFTDLAAKMKGKGILPIVRNYYLDMDSNYRMKYKFIKPAFHPEASKLYGLMIVPDSLGPPPPEKSSLIKKLVKKAIKILRASKELDDKDLELLKEVLSLEEEQLNG